MHFSHDTFLSPLTWRYGSQAMRSVWSEEHKRRLLRRFWVALAEGQQACGLVSAAQSRELRARQDDVDLARAAEIEKTVKHDLMAEIMAFAEQCPEGGAIIHLGATSNDALDNVDALRMRESLDLLLRRLKRLLRAIQARIEEWAHVPAMAFTHLQPAEPTTLGYRMACYGQDLLMDLETLQQRRRALRGKGVKGAVGTAASFQELLAGTGHSAAALEAQVMARLDLEAFPVATQTMTRKQELDVVGALSSLASSLHKFALDSRLLQGQMIGEWREAFGQDQVGSSAMPFKRNPVAAENICSLARQIAAQTSTAWQNHAHAMLERALDDSGNRRLLLPEAFLLTDEILERAGDLVQGLSAHTRRIRETVATYGPFAASERVLLAAAKNGGDRQTLHALIRGHCLAAWEDVQQGRPDRLAERLATDAGLTQWLPAEQVRRKMSDVGAYVGDAPARALALAADIAAAVAADPPRQAAERAA